jgi:hypothetical protein
MGDIAKIHVCIKETVGMYIYLLMYWTFPKFSKQMRFRVIKKASTGEWGVRNSTYDDFKAINILHWR